MLSNAVYTISSKLFPTFMSKPQIVIRISPSILEKLNNYVEQTGVSKTDVVIGALAQYLGCAEDVPLSQRLTALEAKVEKLEALVAK